MQRLVLLRHGESIYNQKNLFTGVHDVELTEKGKKQAQQVRLLCRHCSIDYALSSNLRRSTQTREIALQAYPSPIRLSEHSELNERDYGALNGTCKQTAVSQYGEEQVQRWRRGFFDRPPGGASLSDTYQCVTDFYIRTVEPLLSQRKNVLIVAHGNSLRALAGYLLTARYDVFHEIEIAWCAPWVFTIHKNKITQLDIYSNDCSQAKNSIHASSEIIVRHHTTLEYTPV